MCVDDDSYPPIPPIAGGATDTRDLRLTSADGTRFMAFGARATAPTGAGMIVIPDVRGLHRYYKELATRFAEVGVDAVAFDFFARTASTEDRSESFDFMSQVPLTKPETLQADIAAAAAYLRGPEGGAVKSLYSVGFCFGGAISYLQAASGLGYAGRDRLLRLAARPQALAGPAEADRRGGSLQVSGAVDLRRRGRGHPAGRRRPVRGRVQARRGRHDSTVYPGAPHSFFDRKYDEFKEASADAWRRVQQFVGVPSGLERADKGPSASLAPSTARSTYRDVRLACGLSGAAALAAPASPLLDAP